jgi:hypothetical protein
MICFAWPPGTEQHVIDLLREKLNTGYSELAEHKERVASLEARQAKDTEALTVSAEQLGKAGTRMPPFVTSSGRCRSQSIVECKVHNWPNSDRR